MDAETARRTTVARRRLRQAGIWQRGRAPVGGAGASPPPDSGPWHQAKARKKENYDYSITRWGRPELAAGRFAPACRPAPACQPGPYPRRHGREPLDLGHQRPRGVVANLRRGGLPAELLVWHGRVPRRLRLDPL